MGVKYVTADATAPGHSAVPVVPSDATILIPTRALYVGTTGNITAKMAGNDATVLFSNVPVGILPIQVTQVLATGTTATNIVALR